ncbi:hypothetical protein GCM10010524_64180 [Streptomyces mexicanus]
MPGADRQPASRSAGNTPVPQGTATTTHEVTDGFETFVLRPGPIGARTVRRPRTS